METLVNVYKTYLKDTKANKQAEIDKFLAEHCEDDANLAKIEYNIIDIFDQMFAISEKKAMGNRQNSKETLKETYLAFFEKIPKSWYENREKSIAFDDVETTHKENLKIHQATMLKNRFIELYEEV